MRKNDVTAAPGHGRRSLLRLGMAMLAVLVLGLAVVPASQAATGGASSLAATPEPEAAASSEIAFGGFRLAGASWYGPGLWGRQTACGQTLRPTTIGVAHKTLPCGTMVKFVYHGRAVLAPVIDRGPYINGRSFDLTAAAAQALDFEGVGVGTVRYALPIEYASKGLG